MISVNSETKGSFILKSLYLTLLHTLLFMENVLIPFQGSASSLCTRGLQRLRSLHLNLSFHAHHFWREDFHPKSLSTPWFISHQYSWRISPLSLCYPNRETGMWSLCKMTDWKLVINMRLKLDKSELESRFKFHMLSQNRVKGWGGGESVGNTTIPQSLCSEIFKVKTRFLSGSSNLSNIKSLGSDER